MTKFLPVSLLACSLCVNAQTFRSTSSFTYTKLSAYSNRFADAFAFGANQGALSGIKKFSAGVYSERRFGLTELSSYAVAAVLPATSGNFGFKGDYFGGQAYNESSLALAYGRSLGSKVSVGLQFNYLSFKAAGYGGASNISFDAGLILHLTAQLTAGLQTANPLSSGWGKDGTERLPAIYRIGLGYDASEQVYVGLETEKIEDKPVGINAGLHYSFSEKLLARAGIGTATEIYYLGFGVKLKQLRVDVTASIHPYLGVTPGLLLHYSLPE